MGLIKEIACGLKDLTFPKICLACKNKITGPSVDGFVCMECWANIKKNVPPFCLRCGRSLRSRRPVKGVCADCLGRSFYFDRAFCPCSYEGVIKELIHMFKYRNKKYLASVLVKPIFEYIKEYDFALDFIDLIVPVPLSKARLREREFNQSLALAGYIAKEFNKPLSSRALIRHKHAPTQTELTNEERMENVKGIFSVKDRAVISGKNILLVDDVLTTGSTASEAARALKNSGSSIVYALTLAN